MYRPCINFIVVLCIEYYILLQQSTQYTVYVDAPLYKNYSGTKMQYNKDTPGTP